MKIVDFKPRGPQEPEQPEPNHDLIEILEEMLASARAGNTVGMMGVGYLDEEDRTYEFFAYDHRTPLDGCLGRLVALQTHIANLINELEGAE